MTSIRSSAPPAAEAFLVVGNRAPAGRTVFCGTVATSEGAIDGEVSDNAVASEGNKCEGVVGTALGGRGLASVMA